MGLEMSIQAVPEAWRQIQDETGKDIWQEVVFMETWEDDAEEDDPESLLPPVVRALIIANPGIEQRGFYLEKRWDILSFMLSDSYRLSGDAPMEPDIGWIAVRGEHAQDGVTGAQGMPMSYTPPETLEHVRAFLGTVADDDLRRSYALAATTEQDIYRFDPVSACDPECEEIISCFHDLRDFYGGLRPDEAVLFWID